jgi:ribonucleotide reductase alpha subunit
MRNSNCLAIAPTATIANIVGVSASIEPNFQNLYVKSNLSGEFTVTNEYLVRDLKDAKLWDEVMISDLKYFDGSLAQVDRIPAELRTLYATAFEMDPSWLVEAGSRRQKWIDQAQSLNIYMGGASGKKLDDTYKLAWKRGLKTTYYLRTLAATAAEKSTGRAGELTAVSAHGTGMQLPPKRPPRKRSSAASTIPPARPASKAVRSTLRSHPVATVHRGGPVKEEEPYMLSFEDDIVPTPAPIPAFPAGAALGLQSVVPDGMRPRWPGRRAPSRPTAWRRAFWRPTSWRSRPLRSKRKCRSVASG